MKEFNRCIISPRFQIDANRINAKQKLPYMNQLEVWKENGVIILDMSETAMHEASMGSGNKQRKSKTMSMIFSVTCATTPDESILMEQICRILFPNKTLTKNEKRDVEIVFNAAKYRCTLITNDGASKKQPGGILGHRVELREKIGINVLTDAEAVALVKEIIEKRDIYIKKIVAKYGGELPSWVGKD